MEKEAETAFKTSTLDVADARRKAAMAAAGEHEAAQIQHGATGMAYSAPVMRGYDLEESESTMEDITRAERDFRQTYAGDVKKIKSERDAAELGKTEAEKQYYLDIESAWSDTQTALDESLDRITGILATHEGAAGTYMKEPGGMKGMNIGGTKFFDEPRSKFGDYTKLKSYQKKAQKFKDASQSAAQTQYGLVGND